MAGFRLSLVLDVVWVSTHSHPKVAGRYRLSAWRADFGFNTQPPEGGWAQNRPPTLRQPSVSTHSHPKVAGSCVSWCEKSWKCFNTQPPEGGWPPWPARCIRGSVSTHSHPKVAGASLKSLVPSGFEAPISLSFQEKREREYNTAFSVTPSFTIS